MLKFLQTFLTHCQNLLPKFARQVKVENIPDADNVSRFIVHPHMINDDHELLWIGGLFQFKTLLDGSKEPESVVWRKYANNNEVHHLGHLKASTNERHSYRGFITGNVLDIRSRTLKRSGGRFTVLHVPPEGIQHAEIELIIPNKKKLKKGDKGEIFAVLEEIFKDDIVYELATPKP